MVFPVDLVSVSHEDLEISGQLYMADLLYTNPDHAPDFTLPSGRKVPIRVSHIGFVPLYGANHKHKVLALFTPEDLLKAVALFVADQWYAVDDILKTSDPTRDGLLQVRSVSEWIVLYVLNRIIYRINEMDHDEVPFLCHSESDFVKILWKNGEAVGFYSVKSTGSVCNPFVSQCYLLPVLTSMFVRKAHRGKGHGLQMLEDYVCCFTDSQLGIRCPLSPAMYRVCQRYLELYPGDVDLLWEVEGVGGPYQRTKLNTKLNTKALQAQSAPQRNVTSALDPSVKEQWAADIGSAQGAMHGDGNMPMSTSAVPLPVLGRLHFSDENGSRSRDATETTDMETSLDITEELVVTNKHLKVAEDMDDTPISTRTRSSEHQQRKRVREEDSSSTTAESQPLKINRVEEHRTEPAEEELVGKVSEMKGKIDGEEEAAPDEGEMDDSVAPEASATGEKHEELAAEVNGELTENSGTGLNEEEEVEEIAKGAEEEDLGSEEVEPVLQNGTADEEEEQMDVDEGNEARDTPVEKEVMDPADNTDRPASEELNILEENPEEQTASISEQSQEAEGDSLDEELQKEEIAPVLMEEHEEVPHTAEEGEGDHADEEETELDVASKAVEEQSGEEINPTSEEEGDQASDSEEENIAEAEEDKELELILAEESSPLSAVNHQEEEEKHEERPVEKEGTTDWSVETKESQPSTETKDEEEQKRGIIEKDEQTGAIEEEEEEEDEEHNAVEEQEEEPPVIDRRVLRRKSRVAQATSHSKSKRRSKI